MVAEDRAAVDRSRPTAADNLAPAKPVRAIDFRVYMPAVSGTPAVKAGPFPMFVWAHGLNATVGYFDSLLRFWASAGYVVVAPTFPLTHSGTPGGPRFDDYVNQPADVSFVINEVLSRDGRAGSEHPGLVDGDRIGAGGHSLGAITTIGLVSNRCCVDGRVGAAVEIDGANLPFPDGATVERGTPLLLIHGDADSTFPVQDGRDIYSASLAPKYLVVLHGVPHTGFAIPRALRVIETTVADFLDVYLKQRPGASDQLRKDGTIPGFTTLSAAP